MFNYDTTDEVYEIEIEKILNTFGHIDNRRFRPQLQWSVE